MSQARTRISTLAGALALGLLAAPGQAGLYPPHQFRLTDPSGPVQIENAAGEARRVDARALVAQGETVSVGRDASARLRVAQIGILYVQAGSKFVVKKVEEDGRPVLELLGGSVLAKTREIGAEKPLEVEFGPNRLLVTDGMIELRYNPGKNVAALAPLKGSPVVEAGGRSVPVSENLFLVRDDGKTAKRPLDKAEVRGRWETMGPEVLDSDIEDLQDEVSPVVTLEEPTDMSQVDSSQLTIRGSVDDPGVGFVRVNVNGVYRENIDVVQGNFTGTIVLRDSTQEIVVEAHDDARNVGTAKANVRCRHPAPPLKPKEPEDKSFVTRVKKAMKDPSKDPEAIMMVAAGAFLIFLVGIVLVRMVLKNLKKGAETAAGLATGVIFNRCETCGERQYEYHLFYTTEPVTSPFMRNLINNVNPMATSIMNESLENLLNTGLQGSAGAKGAEQNIRVTCTWCDQCKVGNLKLEHMKAGDVFKTDDYQIIHPIFIEWVRKVYD